MAGTLSTLFKFSVEFPSRTGLSKDKVFHDWWFGGLSGDFSGSLTDAGTALQDFYNRDGSSPFSVLAPVGYMAYWLDYNHVLIHITQVDIATGATVSVIADDVVNWSDSRDTEGDVADLPAETALCLSYHASPSDAPAPAPHTNPRARIRGRVYLGPWHAGVATSGTGLELNYSRPSTTLVSTVKSSANNLLTASNASDTFTWVQYSRAQRTVSAVTGGWVDDEWDTQRRRQHRATYRSVFP